MPNWGSAGKSAAKGAAKGAAIGSFVPGIGTGIGAGIGGIVGGIRGLFGGRKKSPTGPSDYEGLMSGYQDFAKTGGFSPEGISAIRARSVSPFRAIYANAQRGIDRQRALQGGYSPNYTAAMTRMARESSQGLSDANTNVEAEIADMINKNRLAGLQGGSSLWGTRQNSPSDYQRRLSSIGGTMNLIGKGAGALGQIFG